MTELYKLARPLMQGVQVEILSGRPYKVQRIFKRVTQKWRDEHEEIPNRMVAEILGDLPQFRGEVVVGNPIDADCHENTRIFLDGKQFIHPFVFWVYDIRTTEVYDLRRRLEIAKGFVDTTGPCIQYVDHDLIESEQALVDYKHRVITENFFPGVVLREPFGTYGTKDEIIKAGEGETPATAITN